MIVVVTGTGTGVGKTHIACALVTGLRARGLDAVGWKPVESGVDGAIGADEALLAAASNHVAVPPTIRLRAALSPHLAARREGIAIDGSAIRTRLDELALRHTITIVELAGGLFSPFDDRSDNADWLGDIDARLIVVAPDRLGVLHDCGAVIRAVRRIHAFVLSPPAAPDASTGTNADELRRRPKLSGITVVAVTRAATDELCRDGALVELAMP